MVVPREDFPKIFTNLLRSNQVGLLLLFKDNKKDGSSEMFFKISVLKNFANLKVCNFIKRDSSTGVFCEIYEIFQNTFFYRTRPVASFKKTQGQSQTAVPDVKRKLLLSIAFYTSIKKENKFCYRIMETPEVITFRSSLLEIFCRKRYS